MCPQTSAGCSGPDPSADPGIDPGLGPGSGVDPGIDPGGGTGREPDHDLQGSDDEDEPCEPRLQGDERIEAGTPWRKQYDGQPLPGTSGFRTDLAGIWIGWSQWTLRDSYVLAQTQSAANLMDRDLFDNDLLLAYTASVDLRLDISCDSDCIISVNQQTNSKFEFDRDGRKGWSAFGGFQWETTLKDGDTKAQIDWRFQSAISRAGSSSGGSFGITILSYGGSIGSSFINFSWSSEVSYLGPSSTWECVPK